MKAVLSLRLTAIVAQTVLSPLQTTEKQSSESKKQKLVGAWHLISLESPEPDGKTKRITGLMGMLLYTADGHMSVQLMYPKSASDLTNDYVKNGYEASFGSYDVDENAHTVTHHVQGSITEGL
jgi:hypothetical protein